MMKWWYFTYCLIVIDYSSFKTYGRWWALYSQQTHPEAKFEGCDKNIFFSREFRLFSLQFGYCVDNKLLIVIRDLVNVDTKRSYLCLTQTFIVLWMAWSVSTSTDAVASSRRRILFLGCIVCMTWCYISMSMDGDSNRKEDTCKGSAVSLWKGCNILSKKRPGQANQLFLPDWEVLSFWFHVHH